MLVPFLFLAVVHELAHTIVARLHKVPHHDPPITRSRLSLDLASHLSGCALVA